MLKYLFLLLPFFCAAQNDTAIKRIDVNLASTAPYKAWQNNWDGAKAAPLKYTDGFASSVTASLSASVMADNGTAYNVTIFPREVGREVSYAGLARTLTLSGLDDKKLYDIRLLASRNKFGQSTRFTVAGVSKTIATENNYTKLVAFDNVKSTNGVIVVNIETAAGEYNYLNAFTIDEKTITARNRYPILNLKDTTLYFGRSGYSYVIDGYDPDGDTVSYTIRRVSSTDSVYLATSTPANGAVLSLNIWGRTERYYVQAIDSKGAMTDGYFNVTLVYDPKHLFDILQFGSLGMFGVYVDGSVKKLD